MAGWGVMEVREGGYARDLAALGAEFARKFVERDVALLGENVVALGAEVSGATRMRREAPTLSLHISFVVR